MWTHESSELVFVMLRDGYFVDRPIHCCRIGNVSYVNYYLPDICPQLTFVSLDSSIDFD